MLLKTGLCDRAFSVVAPRLKVLGGTVFFDAA